MYFTFHAVSFNCCSFLQILNKKSTSYSNHRIKSVNLTQFRQLTESILRKSDSWHSPSYSNQRIGRVNITKIRQLTFSVSWCIGKFRRKINVLPVAIYNLVFIIIYAQLLEMVFPKLCSRITMFPSLKAVVSLFIGNMHKYFSSNIYEIFMSGCLSKHISGEWSHIICHINIL